MYKNLHGLRNVHYNIADIRMFKQSSFYAIEVNMVLLGYYISKVIEAVIALGPLLGILASLSD